GREPAISPLRIRCPQINFSRKIHAHQHDEGRSTDQTHLANLRSSPRRLARAQPAMKPLLIQGDARRICLDDGVVQMVVTSPPYWGLRDYGLEPSVWDGREDCAHEWADELFIHNGGPQGKSDHRPNRDNSARNAMKDRTAGRFCVHCGAWRGCLGLEP